MFGRTKEEINFIAERVIKRIEKQRELNIESRPKNYESLERRVKILEWLFENPPLYKKGFIKGNIKVFSNRIIGENNYCRLYMVSVGDDLEEIYEEVLTEIFKNIDKKK